MPFAELFRVSIAGGEGEKIPVPSQYRLTVQPLSAAAVDARGRILFPVLSANTFYYRPVILDLSNHSLTAVPVSFEGDVSLPAWLPDGRIGAAGARYAGTLWRYRSATENPARK